MKINAHATTMAWNPWVKWWSVYSSDQFCYQERAAGEIAFSLYQTDAQGLHWGIVLCDQNVLVRIMHWGNVSEVCFPMHIWKEAKNQIQKNIVSTNLKNTHYYENIKYIRI